MRTTAYEVSRSLGHLVIAARSKKTSDERDQTMKLLSIVLMTVLCVVPLFGASPCQGHTKTQGAESKTAVSPEADAQKKNLQAYIDLLREDVRQQKAEIMGSVMVLSAEDAAKFWPIYSDYDAELTKLNNQRVANIKEYARTYTQLTDEKADELIHNALAYRKQRSELLAKTYDRVKRALGAITAARFVQVEDQLLSIIDLQIAAELPL